MMSALVQFDVQIPPGLTRNLGGGANRAAKLNAVAAAIASGRTPIEPHLARICKRTSFAKLVGVARCELHAAELATLNGIPGLRVLSSQEVGRGTVARFTNSDQEFSYAFRDLTQTDLFDPITASSSPIGLVEYSKCDANGEPQGVDAGVPALSAAEVRLLNQSFSQDFYVNPHAHQVLTSMTHYNADAGTHDVLPQNTYLVANLGIDGLAAAATSPCGGNVSKDLFEALDWFVQSGVRLVNRSTFSASADCSTGPAYEEEALLDIYARTFDLVVTTAAGQTSDGTGVDCAVFCDAQNQTCVGAAVDLDKGNVGTPDDLDDDEFLSGYAGTLPWYRNAESWIRDEPDVVAPYNDIEVSVADSDQVARQSGTSLGAPLTLSLFAKQLEAMSSNGEPWETCRVSEFVRAMAEFSAVQHPVFVDGVPRSTAPHTHPVSANPDGNTNGSRCSVPDDCEDGLTCLFGHCGDPPSDSAVGWGMASSFMPVIEGDWGCHVAAAGQAGDCAPGRNGECTGRVSPQDAILPSELGAEDDIQPAPGKDSVSPGGFFLGDALLDVGDHFRGSLAWSSCPVPIEDGSIHCSTTADCPQFTYCGTGFGSCQSTHSRASRVIPAADFDVAMFDTNNGTWTWLSYSPDDVTETFDYVASESGLFQFWAFPTRPDWDCDESRFGHADEDGEFLIFVGGEL